ncbi:MAG: Xaa-Pro peptidase family protein [Dehalococcoidia bacterium]
MDLLKELTREPVPKELAFTRAEYDDRMAKVRRLMEMEGLDVLLVNSTVNLCYLTGYQTLFANWYACLVLPRQGEPVMHVPEIEIPAALVHGWEGEVAFFKWYEYEGATDQLARVLKERGFERGAIGVELDSEGITAGDYQRLQLLLPQAKFKDATGLVFRVRVVKSPAEIEHLREAARITAAGLDAAIEAIAPGKTDNDVAAAAQQAIVKAGSEFLSIEPIVATGHRSGLIHTTHKRFPLKVGDTLILEFGGCYQRYTAPTMRAAVIGEPSDLVRRMADACLTTVSLIFENARPGRTGHEVALAAKKGLEPVASETYHHGAFGYSVGIGFPPTWTDGPMYLAEGVDKPLEPGMTFHLPITNRSPGRCGVGFSETLLVTETGCEALSCHQPRELAVVPA